MMALTCLQFDGSSVKISNAGMPPILFFKKGEGTIEEVSISNMPLGSLKDFEYEMIELPVESGDTFLLYTDGLPELQNSKEEMYSYERLLNKFENVVSKTANEIKDELKNSYISWVGDIDPEDDITFIVVKIN